MPAPVTGEINADTVAQMEAAVTAAVPSSGASGAIVGVWAPWSGEWVFATGTTQLGGSKPVTTDMSFRVGRITREMTCDALYGMVDDGIVELGDKMSKYIPGLGRDSQVTLKQLCDSTSGIPAISGNVYNEFITNPERVWQPRELASFGYGRTTKATPGEGFVDADTNYFLLGMALANASKLTMQEVIDKYVTTPLGLTSTELPGDKAAAPAPSPALPGHIVKKVEEAWACDAPLDVTKLSASTGYTDSGVTSTIDDLGLYARALASGALEGPKGRFADPFEVPKASTWYTAAGGSIMAGSMIGQFGKVPGYTTAAFSDPETGLTVAVVMNSSTGSASTARDLAFQLAALASKTPATDGRTAPEFGLPWTADQFPPAAAICAAPPAE